MNAKTMACHSDHIEAFLAGDLLQRQLVEFEQHLDGCARCDAELTRRTAGESFWEDAREFLSTASEIPAGSKTQHSPSNPMAPSIDPDSQEGDLDIDGNGLGFLDPTDDPRMLGRFGGYEISAVIGRGGMGVVMKGWDISLDRFVAIKVLNPTYSGQSASRQRFAREAQAAAAVLHDNVIAIYGVDQWNEMPYLVMPYIKGESLQHRIDRAAPLSLEDILGISLQIARGLSAAHDQGLVHRDIKPANILMPASVSRVIITDFGLARTADDASLTRSGVLAGTPQYMSPEQAKGDAIDGRTDLFSLGSVMYAMACGRPPFRAETTYGVLRKITDDPHRPLSQIRGDTPPWFEDIIDRLLQKDPSMRFETAGDLAAHLEDCLAHLRQPSTTLLPKLAPPIRRSRHWASLLIACAVLMAAITGLTVWQRHLFPVLIPDRPHSLNAIETPTRESTSISATSSNHSQSPDESAPDLSWEFDDSKLKQIESDLAALIQETATVVPADIRHTDKPSTLE